MISAGMDETQSGPSLHTDEHGFTWDQSTGELVEGPVRESGDPGMFTINDPTTLEGVMERMLRADSAVAAIEGDARLIEARAVVANAEAMVEHERKKAEWWRTRFGPEIERYAAESLKDSKSRSIKTIYGTVSLRRVKAGIEVHDETLALAWARENLPEAVKVNEKLLVSMIPLDRADGTPGLDVRPERDSLTIKTGVGS